MDIPIYIVNYKNNDRKIKMTERFNQLGINPKFINEVHSDDVRLNYGIDINLKRTWAIMLQHLDCIRDFYENSDKLHCIVCEDDIYISKNYQNNIVNIVKNFDELNLDVLMLGYLLSYKIEMNTDLHKHYFSIVHNDNTGSYHSYPDDIWGTQMYLISKNYAEFLLNKFTPQFAFENIGTLNYSPDWIITKNGKRALINPMIAVEEGINVSDDEGQRSFHKISHQFHYNSDIYI